MSDDGPDDGTTSSPDTDESTTAGDDAEPAAADETAAEQTTTGDEAESTVSDDPEAESTAPEGTDESTPGEGEVYCRDCGAVISEKAEICPACGVRQRSSTDDLIEVLTNGENPFVAAVYSAILPGLGQFYNREPKKGALIVVASMIAAFSIVAFVGIVLFPAVWLYAVYDAYVVADGRSAPLS